MNITRMTLGGEAVVRARSLRDRVEAARDVTQATPELLEALGGEDAARGLAIMLRQVVTLDGRRPPTLMEVLDLPEELVLHLVALAQEVDAKAASFRDTAQAA